MEQITEVYHHGILINGEKVSKCSPVPIVNSLYFGFHGFAYGPKGTTLYAWKFEASEHSGSCH